MEITAQITALEDEVKVLKNEIQTILKEIRAAVLATDNPFAPEGAPPVFRPVSREQPAGEPLFEPEEASQESAPEAAPVTQPAESRGPTTMSAPASPREEPLPRVVPVERTTAPPESAPVEAAPPEETPLSQRWTVSTIASLVAWIDETSARLGPAHLHIILDLASFAGLLPKEAEEVLLKVVKLAGGRKDSAPPSVNDVLVALRQLESIFQQAEDDQLSFMGRRRSAGGSR